MSVLCITGSFSSLGLHFNVIPSERNFMVIIIKVAFDIYTPIYLPTHLLVLNTLFITLMTLNMIGNYHVD